MVIKLTDEQIKQLKNGEDITIKAPCKEVDLFEARGDYCIYGNGAPSKPMNNSLYKKYFNLWQTKEQAVEASRHQRKVNIIMNYVMQFDGRLGTSIYYVYKDTDNLWNWGKTNGAYYPETISMSQECAKALIKDLNSDQVNLEEE